MSASSTSNSVGRRSTGLPGGRGVWTSIGIATTLILVALFVFDGTMAGVLGLWGLSLFAATILGYGVYRLWYRYGS